MAKRSKDLFDDSVMTFGEHLESLRGHVIKALIGVVLAMIVCLYKGDVVVGIVRTPLDNALRRQGMSEQVDADVENTKSMWERGWKSLVRVFGGGGPVPEVPKPGEPTPAVQPPDVLTVKVSKNQLLNELHRSVPEQFPNAVAADAKDEKIDLTLESPVFKEMRYVMDLSRKPVTLNVQEGFMTYLKLSGVAGLI